jgi:hypothetical protein
VKEAIESISSLEESFNSQTLSESEIIEVSREDMFESAEASWLATSGFWSTFVLPRLRTCFLRLLSRNGKCA